MRHDQMKRVKIRAVLLLFAFICAITALSCSCEPGDDDSGSSTTTTVTTYSTTTTIPQDDDTHQDDDSESTSTTTSTQVSTTTTTHASTTTTHSSTTITTSTLTTTSSSTTTTYPSTNIVYGTGNVVIGTVLQDDGYLYIYSSEDLDRKKGNFLSTLERKIKDDEKDSTSITLTLKSKYSFKKYFLGPEKVNLCVATDSNDNLHFSYFNNTDHTLHYTVQISGKWVDNIIMTNNSAIDDLDLKIDHENHAHMCFMNNDNKNIVYATNASGFWVFEDVGPYGSSPTLALDSEDYAHISYIDYFGMIATFYATNRSGSWKIQLVMFPSTPPYPYLSIFEKPSIAINNDDIPYICVVNVFFYPVVGTYGSYTYCGTLINNKWDMQLELDYTGYEQGEAVLLIDNNNYLHLLYSVGLGGPNSPISHAYNGSGTFVTESVTTYDGECVSSTFDKNGKIHLAFIITDTPYDHYIGYANNVSGTWKMTILCEM